jgi:hypothetical protein
MELKKNVDSIIQITKSQKRKLPFVYFVGIHFKEYKK